MYVLHIKRAELHLADNNNKFYGDSPTVKMIESYISWDFKGVVLLYIFTSGFKQ